MVMKKENVYSSVVNADKQIESSHISATQSQAKMYNRGDAAPEDPWLCAIDYHAGGSD